MSSTSPLGQPDKLPPDPLKVAKEADKGKKGTNTNVEQAVLGKLPSESAKSTHVKGFWSSLNPWSKKAGQKTPQQDQSQSSPQGETLELSDSVKAKKAQQVASQIEQTTTTIKPYTPAKHTKTENFIGWGIKQVVKTGVVKSVLNQYDFNKDDVIVQKKQEMLNHLQDPQYVEFYELIKTAMLPSLITIAKELVREKTGDSADKTISPELLEKIFEVIFARGFANLAEEVNKNLQSFPPKERQTSLVSVISLLAKRTEPYIDQVKLQAIEEKYRPHRTNLIKYTQKLFPGMNPEVEGHLQKYIQDYTKYSTTHDRQAQIKQDLFPHLRYETGQRAVDIGAFFASLDALHQKNIELHNIFAQVSNQIILCLFPEKAASIPELTGTITPIVSNIFGGIEDTITEYLQDLHASLENDEARNQAWKEDLQQRLGAPDLGALMEAPSALTTALAKKIIQSEPRVVSLTAEALNGIVHPEANQIPQDPLVTLNNQNPSVALPLEPLDQWNSAKRNLLLDELSQERLASWLVESAQAMLHSTDSNLGGLGNYMQQALNNLTLALVAKGSKIVFDEDKQIASNAFLKEFIEHLIAKANTVLNGNESIPEQFWTDLIKDLPLPLKGIIAPELKRTWESSNEKFKGKVDLQEILDIGAKAEADIQAFDGGDQLLFITEKIGDQLMSIILKQTDSAEMSGLMEEMLAEYLPNVAIDDQLKQWFKQNISALGKNQDQSPTFLKKGIQAILRHAMVNTINKNFQGNGKDYAKQLLTNFHHAFAKTFAGFNDAQKAKLNKALKKQALIDAKNARIKEIQTLIVNKPANISEDQKTVVEEVMGCHIRYLKGVSDLEGLENHKNEILANLNALGGEPKWTSNDLLLVEEALILRNIEKSSYSNVQDHRTGLKNNLDNYDKLSGNLTPEQIKEKQVRRILLALLSTDQEKMELLSKAVHINTTLKYANKEVELLKKEFEKQLAKTEVDLWDGDNLDQWQTMKTWVDEVIKGKEEIKELSQEIAGLEKSLDKKLEIFQTLAEELTSLLGLADKDALGLPKSLQEGIWPRIESAKKKEIARLLFTRLTPIIVSINDLQVNKDKLNNLSKGNPVLSQMVHAITTEVNSRIPELVTNFKPSAKQILSIMEISDPTATEIQQVEDLNSFILPQLHSIIASNDPAFQSTREMLQKVIEGTIIRIFVKHAEASQAANPTQDPLTTITQKLRDLASVTAPQPGQTVEAAAKQMIDQVFAEVLGISVKEDLDSLPLELREIVFENLHTQAYQFALPLVQPMIERNQNRLELEQTSGSKFLGDLCESFSNDLFFKLLPKMIKSHQTISKEVFELVAGKEPIGTELVEFTQAITNLIQNKAVSHEEILKAYAKVTLQIFEEDEFSDLIEKLKEKGIEEAFNNIIMTPEAIAVEIGKLSPYFDDQLQKSLTKALKGLLNNPEIYKNSSEFAKAYLEGVLLKVFLKVAQQNPHQGSKDSMVILIEKFISVANAKYQTALNGSKTPDAVLEELKDALMNDVLGIEAPLATNVVAPSQVNANANLGIQALQIFPGLPDSLQVTAYNTMKEQLGKIFLNASPLLTSMVELQNNKTELQKLSNGNPFLGKIIHAVSEEMIDHIPELISYQPAVMQILTVMGVDEPTDTELARMEAALHRSLMNLGKPGITFAMLKPLVKGFVAYSDENDFSQSLITLIGNGSNQPISAQDVLALLKAKVATVDPKIEQQLVQRAQELTKEINQQLLNLGKLHLTNQHLLEVYQDQIEGNQQAIPVDQTSEVLEALQSQGILEKIKNVVKTPEEIAQDLIHFIPPETNLHGLLAPHLEAGAKAVSVAVQANPAVLQQLLEGTVTRLFVKIANSNKPSGNNHHSVMGVITEKIKNLAETTAPKAGKTVEETAHEMIDQVLQDVIGIATEADLEIIPKPLQKLVFEKLHQQAYEQITPLIRPVIEKNESRNKLQEISGSNFLSSLCEAFTKDFFILMPSYLKKHEVLAKDVFILLSGHSPTQDQLKEFTAELSSLIQQKNVKNHAIATAYAKITKTSLSINESTALVDKLKEKKIEEAVNGIIITPEEIAAAISKLAPHVDDQLQNEMADELQKFLNDPDIYPNGSEFARSYIEGVLLKVFIQIAKKNPKQENKDTLIVLTEKLLDIAVKKYQAKGEKTSQEIAGELKDAVMKDLLGINSPGIFKGLPESLQVIAYNLLEEKLHNILLNTQQGFENFDDSNPEVQQAKEKSREFGIFGPWLNHNKEDERINKGLVHVLAEDIASFVLTAAPYILSKVKSGNIVGVTIVSKNVESYLEELAHGDIKIAKTLLDYTRSAQFKEMLGAQITDLSQEKKYLDDKKKAAQLLTNIFVVPLNNAVEKAIEFENTHKEKFNQKLMANLLTVAAGHLKNLNQAKVFATQGKRKEVLHEDFVKAAGKDLHAGVPKTDVFYRKTIDSIADRIYGKLSIADQLATGKTYAKLTTEQEVIWINEREALRKMIKGMIKNEVRNAKIIDLEDFVAKFNSIHTKVTGHSLTADEREALKAVDAEGLTLRNLMRQEFDALETQRRDAAYAPATENIMKMIFPNGQKDLTFVPEEMRNTVWGLLEKKLFNQILPLMTEILFDPGMINKMVLKSLEIYQEKMNEPIGEIEPSSSTKPNSTMDELDEAAGELIEQSMKAVILPQWAKNIIVDRKSGKSKAEWNKTLGAVLRSNFNDVFIQETLKTAIESAVERDEKGEYALNFDTRPRAIKNAISIESAQKSRVKMRKAFQKSVDASIWYFVRSKWAEAKASLARLPLIRKMKPSVRTFFEKAFEKIFFELIGNILMFILWPARQLVKQMIYKIISLDQNRENILGMLTKIPSDQPEIGYAVMHEDLLFKAGEALSKTVHEFIDKEPLIPVKDA